MKVEIRLFANLAKLLPPGSQNKRATVIIKQNSTVEDLLEKMKIPLTITNIVMVNGEHKDKDTVLKEGDVVSVFPPIAGG
ncbi:MoaD/ThiS family protein [Candidatus Poribacteria bacterium]|nr:MoaD/ThiS family protein [Candidatus Poribacteria bacterium]